MVGGRRRGAEHGHHGVADVLHHRAALARGWRGSSRRGAGSAGRQHARDRRARRSSCSRGCRSSPRSRRASRSPRWRGRSASSCSATPAGSSRLRRLALLLALDDRLVQHAQPASAPACPADTPAARLTNRRSTRRRPPPASCLRRAGDRLDRAALGDQLEQFLVVGAQIRPFGGTGLISASTIDGSSIEPPVATARIAAPAGRLRRCGPSAGRRSRRTLRRAARWRSRDRRTGLRITMPVPGWRLRISLQASMPSTWKCGGMRMSVTTTSGSRPRRRPTSAS